jgi:hypothetical protein
MRRAVWGLRLRRLHPWSRDTFARQFPDGAFEGLASEDVRVSSPNTGLSSRSIMRLIFSERHTSAQRIGLAPICGVGNDGNIGASPKNGFSSICRAVIDDDDFRHIGMDDHRIQKGVHPLGLIEGADYAGDGHRGGSHRHKT